MHQCNDVQTWLATPGVPNKGFARKQVVNKTMFCAKFTKHLICPTGRIPRLELDAALPIVLKKEDKKKSSNAVIEQEAADSVLKLQHASLQHFYRYVTH